MSLLALPGLVWSFFSGGLGKLWRLLGEVAAKINMQGWVGIAAVLLVSIHFGGEARHFSKLYANEHKLRGRAEISLAVANQSVKNLREASYAAQDENRRRVDVDTAARAAVTQETHDAYQVQLARLRDDFARRLRDRPAAAAGGAGGDDLSALSAAIAGAAPEAMPLSASDFLLGAECELQSNTLIDWIQRQHAIDPNKEPSR